jgi:hypothetical protein
MRKLILNLLMVGTLFTMPVIAQNGLPDRTLWVYEGGWFERRNGAQWIEMNRDLFVEGNAPIAFREQRRTKEFVILYDTSRGMFVRLSDTTMEWRQGSTDSWNVLYSGRWKH